MRRTWARYTRPASARSCRWCGHASGWRRWAWAAAGARAAARCVRLRPPAAGARGVRGGRWCGRRRRPARSAEHPARRRRCQAEMAASGSYAAARSSSPVNHTTDRILLVLLLRYDTRCYSNARSKADMSQLNLIHPFNGLFSKTTWVSRYKVSTNKA